MGFSDDMNKAQKKIEKELDARFRAVGMQALSGVVMLSPVGDASLWKMKPPPGYTGGRFRANWQVGINELKEGELNTTDKSGGATISKGSGKLAILKIGDEINLTNNLPYAYRIEYEGWAHNAPDGVMRITLENIKAGLNSV